jgi:hypothetical protein
LAEVLSGFFAEDVIDIFESLFEPGKRFPRFFEFLTEQISSRIRALCSTRLSVEKISKQNQDCGVYRDVTSSR